MPVFACCIVQSVNIQYFFFAWSKVSLHCANIPYLYIVQTYSISTLCSQQYLYIVQSTVSLHCAVNSISTLCNQQNLYIYCTVNRRVPLHVQIILAKAPLLSWIRKLMKDTVPTWILTRQAKNHKLAPPGLSHEMDLVYFCHSC